jgi:GNAT superfamily N-acetyltransferase
VSDGIRTRDRRDHNPELYQLSYAHQALGQSSSGSAGREHVKVRVRAGIIDYGMSMEFDVRPLTAERWSSLDDLFGRGGASNGCWCMYWLLGPAYRKRPRHENKEALRALSAREPPPGLLAFDGELAVGWCRLTPRADQPWLEHARYLAPVDDLPVWSLSCFYIRRQYRGRGVAAALIDGALRAAKRANAPAVEAYPVDTAVPKSTTNLFTGTAAMFASAGFTTVARRTPARPIMRHDLRSVTARPGRG